MIALAAPRSASALASATSAPMTRAIRVPSSGSPMTPVEAMKISLGRAPIALAAASATWATAAAPTPPVKALALPELTISARADPSAQMGAAPVDRGRGALGAGEHARDRRRPVEQRHHDVGSPRIADARGDGREADAGDRGQGGIGLRRQRRERSGSGHGRFRNKNRSGPVMPALARAMSSGQGVLGLSAGAGAAAGASLPGSAAWASGGSGLPSASKSSILAALWSWRPRRSPPSGRHSAPPDP